MSFVNDAIKILKAVGNNWTETSDLQRMCDELELETSENRLLGVFTKLEGIGLLERRSDNELEPISSASWRMTRQGHAFLRVTELEQIKTKIVESKVVDDVSPFKIVATVPRRFRRDFNITHPEIGTTWETLLLSLSEVKSELRIICPYIDESIVALLQAPLENSARIRFITRPQDRASPTLRRIQDNGVVVKYIREESEGTQIYQVHAKAIIVDDKLAYVGSSNLTSTSLYHNFELGLLVSQPAMILLLIEMFDDLFEKYATEG